MTDIEQRQVWIHRHLDSQKAQLVLCQMLSGDSFMRIRQIECLSQWALLLANWQIDLDRERQQRRQRRQQPEAA